MTRKELWFNEGMWGMKILGLIGLCLVLVFAARVVMDSFKRLIVKAAWDKWIVATILVALFTSLPEFFVAVAAAIEGLPVISFGNVLGSNIANLSLVVGGAALVMGNVAVVGDFVRWEMSAAFVAGLAPLVLLVDGDLSRFDGLILLVIYVFYIVDTVMMGKHKKKPLRSLNLWKEKQVKSLAVKLIGGMALMLVCADAIVRVAEGLAMEIKVPVLLLSVTVVAIGTSLPELVLGLVAAKRKEMALVFGDLLGGIVANSTLVLGVTALIAPIKLVNTPRIALASLSFVLIFGLVWMFSKVKRRIVRWEGVVLVGSYLMYVGLEFLMK